MLEQQDGVGTLLHASMPPNSSMPPNRGDRRDRPVGLPNGPGARRLVPGVMVGAEFLHRTDVRRRRTRRDGFPPTLHLRWPYACVEETGRTVRSEALGRSVGAGTTAGGRWLV